MNKHTPAPWKIDSRNIFDDCIIIITNSGYPICKVRYDSRDLEEVLESECNAEIISLAPLMFKYLLKKSSEGCEYAKNILSLINK